MTALRLDKRKMGGRMRPRRANLLPMQRFLALAALFVSLGLAQQSKPPKEQEPPEEDESRAPKEYTFNPLQASNEMQIGSYYFRAGKYKAAERRFQEAAKWNPSLAEAFLKLGETEEKLKNREDARTAYSKYLELAPDGKNAEAVRKKLAARH